MAASKGIALDGKGELVIDGGGIALAEPAGQTVENVLKAARGEFKEAPLVGGEVYRMQNGTPDPLWCVRLKTMLGSVGIDVSDVRMSGGEITVDI